MSEASRFPNHRYAPRHYPLPAFPSSRFRPHPQYYPYSPVPPLPNPAQNDPNLNPTATYPPEDHYPFPIPHPGQYEYDYRFPYLPPHLAYGTPHVAVDPHSRIMEQFANPMDQHHKRHNWREEILKGDPDKAVDDNLREASRLVVSLITSGPSDQPYGQGHNLLYFGSPRKPSPYPPVQDHIEFTCFALDASAVIPLNEGDVIPSALELSQKSITSLLPKLDVAKDLKLVRRSKPLLWDSMTVLETFLYRVVEEKEDPESAAGKDFVERLGVDTHYWHPIVKYEDFMATIPSDIISTAITSVYLPPHLSNGLNSIFADQDSRPDALSLQALNVLYACVMTQFARTAFPYYPIPPPPNGQKDFEICEKRRLWAYWTEVIAWHLAHLREDAQVSTSYTLVKSLYPVRPSVDDVKVSLEELERIMINAIASEADRARRATETLIHEGISECLHNPKFAPPENSLEKMHIITAGTSSAVYNVIAKLITHVLARKPSLTESGGKSAINRKIMDLKITVAESRPLSEGVTLALKLSHVVETYLEYRDRGSKHAGQASAAPSVANLGPSALDASIQARLRKDMSDVERLRNFHPQQPPSLALMELLQQLDAKKEKKEPQVKIELITDAAVVSTIMAAGGSNVKPIVLLGADRVLANGNVVNKVGSAQMAWAGKSSGGIVLILCRADRVHSQGMPQPPKGSSASDQLIPGWEPTLGAEVIDQLKGSSHLTISNPTFEDVDHQYISGYITELGFMGHDMLTEFSNMRSDLEKVVWTQNALTR